MRLYLVNRVTKLMSMKHARAVRGRNEDKHVCELAKEMKRNENRKNITVRFSLVFEYPTYWKRRYKLRADLRPKLEDRFHNFSFTIEKICQFIRL